MDDESHSAGAGASTAMSCRTLFLIAAVPLVLALAGLAVLAVMLVGASNGSVLQLRESALY